MRLFSPFKINLELKISGKVLTTDHHLLESHCVFSKTVGDYLWIERSPHNKSQVFCYDSPELESVDNIIIKSDKWVRRVFTNDQLPFFNYYLTKNTPIKAGLGGGSSNAASVIKYLLNYIGRINIFDYYKQIAYEVGADVPAFLYGKSCTITGIGERVKPKSATSLSNWYVIITPTTKSATTDVFTNYDSQQHCVNHDSKNHLTSTALKLYPQLEKYVQAGMQMSGSGSSFFLPCNNREQAIKVYNKYHSDSDVRFCVFDKFC